MAIKMKSKSSGDTKNQAVKRGSLGSPERLVNNDPRLLDTFAPGDVSHQGDLILVCLSAMPMSATPRANRQLADGNTQGSRHVLDRGEVFDCDAAEVVRSIKAATGASVDAKYVGPVFRSPSDPTPHDLTHPEHGHQGFAAGCVVAVVYQRNLDAEERERRTVD